MQLHDLPDRQGLGALLIFGKALDIRRRRRWRSPEDVFQNKGAAKHRGSAIGVGSDHQDAAFAQKPPAIFIRESDSPELVAANVPDTVMDRQPFIEERVVRREQIERASVFPYDAFNKEFHFTPESNAQILVEVGKYETVRFDRVDAAH